MSDVYAPPESELLGTPSGDQPPSQSNGIYPADVGLMFTRGWEVLQPMLVPAALAAAAVFLITMAVNVPFTIVGGVVQGVLEGAVDENIQLAVMIVVQVVSTVLGQVVAAFAAIGMARGSSKLVRTGSVEVSDFLPFDPSLILRAFGGQLLYGLVVMVGFCALIVPGIMATIGLILWPYAMVVEGHGPVDALKRSWQLTDGAKLPMFLFGLGLGLAGAPLILLTCGLGMFVITPFMYTGYALVFEGARANKPEFAG